jgi:hypothetical protein
MPEHVAKPQSIRIPPRTASKVQVIDRWGGRRNRHHDLREEQPPEEIGHSSHHLAHQPAGMRDSLPVCCNYFSARDGKIASLVIVFNQPADY